MVAARAGRYYLISISRLIEGLTLITVDERLFNAMLEQISGDTDVRRLGLPAVFTLNFFLFNVLCTESKICPNNGDCFLATSSSDRLALVSSMLVARPSLLAKVNVDYSKGAQLRDLLRKNNENNHHK